MRTVAAVATILLDWSLQVVSPPQFRNAGHAGQSISFFPAMSLTVLNQLDTAYPTLLVPGLLHVSLLGGGMWVLPIDDK